MGSFLAEIGASFCFDEGYWSTLLRVDVAASAGAGIDVFGGTAATLPESTGDFGRLEKDWAEVSLVVVAREDEGFAG